MEGSGESTLRAKYLDWCSARLAEQFLDLSPEEIYALARPGEGGEAEAPAQSEPVPPGSGSRASGRPRLPRPTEAGYRSLVQRVTEALLRRTPLPTFEQWAEAYAESPERFDAELLGFWKDAVESEPGDA